MKRLPIVKGWAVLHKDSCVEALNRFSYYREWAVLEYLGERHYDSFILQDTRWKKAKRDGWRLVPVEIRVKK